MTRRTFIGKGIVVGTAIVLGRKMCVVREKKYGRITAAEALTMHPRKVRCFLDGVEVTNVTYEADDREGWVRMYVRDEKGFIKCDELRHPVRVMRYGDVRFEIT